MIGHYEVIAVQIQRIISQQTRLGVAPCLVCCSTSMSITKTGAKCNKLPVDIFVRRPYGKRTVWNTKDMQ